nr:alpha/beta hydrolase [Micrococcus terreus]MDK7700447.1 alpha/beta hydrolase [Micrococcus terreus]
MAGSVVQARCSGQVQARHPGDGEPRAWPPLSVEARISSAPVCSAARSHRSGTAQPAGASSTLRHVSPAVARRTRLIGLRAPADGDGLAMPDQIGASRIDLSESTAFVTIPGASHAQFGDYGPQPGDGQPTITNDAARAEVITATSDFLTEIVSP